MPHSSLEVQDLAPWGCTSLRAALPMGLWYPAILTYSPGPPHDCLSQQGGHRLTSVIISLGPKCIHFKVRVFIYRKIQNCLYCWLHKIILYFFKNQKGVMVHACNPTIQQERQEDCHEFRATLSYRVRASPHLKKKKIDKK